MMNSFGALKVHRSPGWRVEAGVVDLFTLHKYVTVCDRL